MSEFVVRPRAIPTTGDDTPAASVFRYLWRMSGHHQVWICALALLVAVLSMVPLELQRRIVNGAIGERDLDLLMWLGALYAFVAVLSAGLKYALRIYQGWLSESAIRYTRAHLGRIHQDRAGARDAEDKGSAVSIIGAEVEKLGGFVGDALSQPVVNLGMLVAIAGYMLVVEPLVAAVSLLFLLPQALVVPLIQRWINRLIERRVTLVREVGDLIAGRVDPGEPKPGRRLTAQLDRVYANRMRIYLLKFAQKLLVNLMNGLAPLGVLVVGGYLVIEGETTIGVIVAFITGFERLSDPLRELLNYYRTAAQAAVQHDMIARWM
jgi:ABC-type bacteriocin/lantibiotic exporter with double-glycine peptidase domain